MTDGQRDRIPEAIAGVLCSSAIVFGIIFGTIAGMAAATPGGWEAWRVGATAAIPITGVFTIFFIVSAIDYVSKGRW